MNSFASTVSPCNWDVPVRKSNASYSITEKAENAPFSDKMLMGISGRNLSEEKFSPKPSSKDF